MTVRKGMKVLALILACAVFVIPGLFASGTGEKSIQDSKGLEKVTISIHPSGHGLPAYIAGEKGFYAEQGLEVETLVYIAAPPQMEAYSTGAWDIGTTGFGGIVLGVAKKDLVILGSSIDDGKLLALWARPDSALAKAGFNESIGAYGDASLWKDKQILMTQGTIINVLLTSTLQRMNLNDDAVKKINMDSSPAYTAFKAGNGDLVQGFAAFYFAAEADGMIPVTTGISQNIFLPSAIIASDKIINERPEVVQAWLRAYMKGVQYIKDNPDEAAQMLVEFSEENGVATDLARAKNFVRLQIKLIPDQAEQLAMFAKTTDGTQTNWQKSLGNSMDFYIKMGNYTKDDKVALLEESNYNSNFMQNL